LLYPDLRIRTGDYEMTARVDVRLAAFCRVHRPQVEHGKEQEAQNWKPIIRVTREPI